MGPTGPQGAAAFTLAIGEVRAVPYGHDPAVTNAGTDQNQIWDLALVTGATGVLTGSEPPTGADGTSLGQLYFCTANQVYYGLVELNENGNKWRPIMTQENSRREYEIDLLATNDQGVAKPEIVGHMTMIMDDVTKQCVLHYRCNLDVPIGTSRVCNIGSKVHTAAIVDLMNNGIDQVKVTLDATVNGVPAVGSARPTLTLTADNIGGLRWAQKHLADALGVKAPSGITPGSRPVFDQGRIALLANEASSQGSSSFGEAPTNSLNTDDLMDVIGVFEKDNTYVTHVSGSGTVVIQYA